MHIDQTIFRSYDIRGIVDEQLTEELVEKIGQAIGTQALKQQQRQLYVARDGRLSGPKLHQALVTGLLSTGCDVIDLGQIPTALLYFATHTTDIHSGVVVTGSHNPANYNGLKITINGQTLSELAIQQLYQLVCKNEFASGEGHFSQQDIIPAYIDYIKKDIQLKRRLKVVIDAGHGIGGKIAPPLFKALGCELIELYCDVDGNFPDHHPDPSRPENLQDLIAAVKEHHADIGLAFDGDADRIGVITDKGEIIWPDRQLILYAQDVLKRHPGAPIIYDVKSTALLAPMIKQAGGEPIMWKTGHSLIKNKLKEIKGPLAGELSGHIFFKERWFGFDDGLYAGARLLEIIATDNRSASEHFADIPDSINTPELKLMVDEDKKQALMEKIKTQCHFDYVERITIDGLRVEFKYGWGLIRPSNTTPCLTIRFEADNEAHLTEIQELFRQQLLNIDPKLDLPF